MPESRPEKFVCTCCGNCCRGEGYVYVTKSDIARLAEGLEITEQEFLKAYCDRHNRRYVLKNHANNDCIFLHDNKCRVHAFKPTQCERWPFWKSVATSRSCFGFAKSYCKGLKDFSFEDFGRVASREELLPRR